MGTVGVVTGGAVVGGLTLVGGGAVAPVGPVDPAGQGNRLGCIWYRSAKRWRFEVPSAYRMIRKFSTTYPV